MDKILDKLITNFGNTAFTCGAFDDGDYEDCHKSTDEYDLLLKENKRIRQELIDYIDGLQSKDE